MMQMMRMTQGSTARPGHEIGPGQAATGHVVDSAGPIRLVSVRVP
jgi:hypothetical protein